MSLDRRIRALEAKMLSEPVILFFEDGSTKEIPGRPELLLQLFLAACRRGQTNSDQAEWLDLIQCATRAREPSGGHLIELIQGAMHARLQGVMDLPADESDETS